MKRGQYQRAKRALSSARRLRTQLYDLTLNTDLTASELALLQSKLEDARSLVRGLVRVVGGAEVETPSRSTNPEAA